MAPDSKLIEVVLKIETGQSLEQDIMAQLKSVGITGSVFIELDSAYWDVDSEREMRKKMEEADRSEAG